jgi:hypothetical protein
MSVVCPSPSEKSESSVACRFMPTRGETAAAAAAAAVAPPPPAGGRLSEAARLEGDGDAAVRSTAPAPAPTPSKAAAAAERLPGLAAAAGVEV